MKKSLCGRILQAGVIGSALALLMLAGRFLPMYMRHITDVRPELSGWYSWGILLGWILALPVFYALVQLWRIFAHAGGRRSIQRGQRGPFCANMEACRAGYRPCCLVRLGAYTDPNNAAIFDDDGINAAVRRRVELGCVLCFKRADAKRSYDARGK